MSLLNITLERQPFTYCRRHLRHFRRQPLFFTLFYFITPPFSPYLFSLLFIDTRMIALFITPYFSVCCILMSFLCRQLIIFIIAFFDMLYYAISPFAEMMPLIIFMLTLSWLIQRMPFFIISIIDAFITPFRAIFRCRRFHYYLLRQIIEVFSPALLFSLRHFHFHCHIFASRLLIFYADAIILDFALRAFIILMPLQRHYVHFLFDIFHFHFSPPPPFID